LENAMGLFHPRAVEGLVLARVLPGVRGQNADVEVLPDRIGHRATSMVPVMGDSVGAGALRHWGSGLEIILGLLFVVPQLSARLEVVSVTLSYPLRPAFCSELLWAERRFGVIGVGIVNYCDEAVVPGTPRRCRPSMAVEALSFDDGDLFFTVLEVTAHERQDE
jgi:hypothetical protein